MPPAVPPVGAIGSRSGPAFENGPRMQVPYISPRDRAPLTEEGDTLRSSSGEVVRVVSGIPRFAESGYAGNYGIQWNRFATTQLDSHTKVPISADRLRRILGGSFDLAAGRLVLEAGAGAGRFSEILAQHAKEVRVTDLSTAIDANWRNNHRFPNVTFAQANIFDLPFPDESFDLAVCLGVLQSTPDPTRALRSLASKVKRGGHVAVDYYRLRLSYLSRIGLVLAHQLVRYCKPEDAFRAVTRLYEIFEPVHRRFARNWVSYLLLTRISPIVTYYHRKDFHLTEERLREWGYLDTHDSLADRYKFLLTMRGVRQACAECGLTPVRLAKGGNGIELLARRD